MELSCRTLPLGRAVNGLVVCPRPTGWGSKRGSHVLLFTADGAPKEFDISGGAAELQPSVLPAFGAGWGRAPVYAWGGVFAAGVAQQGLVEIQTKGLWSPVTPMGAAEITTPLTSLAAGDGRRSLWATDGRSLWHVQAKGGRQVTALPGAAAAVENGEWVSLAFDAVGGGVLLAATRDGVWRVHTKGPGSLALVAGGSSGEAGAGSADGVAGAEARFTCIRGLLVAPGRWLLIADGTDLRCMEPGGAVTTLLRGCIAAPSPGDAVQMAILPSGELAVLYPGASYLTLILGLDQLPPAIAAPPSPDRLLDLLAPASLDHAGSGGGSGEAAHDAAALTGTVTVRVGGRAFPVQRSVLAAGSDFFARLLAPGGGFADSGAAEVDLPDADPTAFAYLLSYMVLAERLLMGGAAAALTERLAAAATPATALSDLLWADEHGMTDLVARLKAFALANRRCLDLSPLRELVGRCPQLATELLGGALRAE
ncbi:hypothetical protein HYH03_018821 [Edaphochlamys debaryana]|uniref:BTB domain-containing protein n=1 Tax=Edaphochlamys debaryana TaxID=47281 RepID=A0A835XDX2_9CHLO|nr:hypothetical protein HYH03_018821 [Edaphochlamys debaryana]|eukprot:KAG2482238.1 hypothetical protein HYH03_018821 [Edaphochlamys debaryana]